MQENPQTDTHIDSPQVIKEITAGEGLSLAEAARSLPTSRGGKRVSPSTLWRWSRVGVKLETGVCVRLEVARMGCRWLTSRAALARFLAAQNPHSETSEPTPQPDRKEKTPRIRRNKRATTIESDLARHGL